MIFANSIFLSYGEQHLQSGLQALNRLQSRVNLSVLNRIVVQNSTGSSGTYRILDSSCRIVEGDNATFDFSGYECGVNGLLERESLVASDSMLVIANDSFHRHYGDQHIKLYDSAIVEEARRTGAILGWVDGYPEPVSILNHSFTHWVRSSLLIARQDVLAYLFPVTPLVNSLDIFSDDENDFFSEAYTLSENYKRFNKAWLLGTPTKGFEEIWHSQSARAGDFNFLRIKMRAILCEHLLSVKARELGIPILDVRTRGYF